MKDLIPVTFYYSGLLVAGFLFYDNAPFYPRLVSLLIYLIALLLYALYHYYHLRALRKKIFEVCFSKNCFSGEIEFLNPKDLFDSITSYGEIFTYYKAFDKRYKPQRHKDEEADIVRDILKKYQFYFVEEFACGELRKYYSGVEWLWLVYFLYENEGTIRDKSIIYQQTYLKLFYLIYSYCSDNKYLKKKTKSWYLELLKEKIDKLEEATD